MAQPTINVQAPVPPNTIPELKNRNGWWSFIAGAPELEWNPPKKPRANKDNKFGKGMRGFADEEALQGELGGAEAELSLPTPHGTPSPSDQCPDGESRTQREPTPTMLRLIDEVRFTLPTSPWLPRTEPLRTEKSSPYSQILHSLDQIGTGTIETHRNPREVDVLPPHPNQRLRILG